MSEINGNVACAEMQSRVYPTGSRRVNEDANVSAMSAESESARRLFSRTNLGRFLNALLWLAFCGMAGTGVLLDVRLPPGSHGGGGLSAMGWGRHDWGALHTWLAYAFLVLVAVHLVLHWRWFWQVAARRRSWPLILGVGAGIALMIALVSQPVKQGSGGRHRDHQRGSQVQP